MRLIDRTESKDGFASLLDAIEISQYLLWSLIYKCTTDRMPKFVLLPL